MLEHVPGWLGHALEGWRAGASKLAAVRPELAPIGVGAPITLGSLAFGNDARLPDRFTADGAGVSPPLHWGELPAGTVRLALLVEDVDAPTPDPLVHAVAWLPVAAGSLAEGALGEDAPDGAEIGHNSFGRPGWLPPDPPTGHGVHRYVFQLFALDAEAGDPGPDPGRTALLRAMEGRVLGVGVLTGTYSRGEPAAVGPAAASVAAAGAATGTA